MANYVLIKAWQFFRDRTLLRSVRKFPGIYDFWQRKDRPSSVGFDLSDARFVHIGDHLFFEPIVRQARQHGFGVKVAPTGVMQEYFIDAGYAVVSTQEVLAQDLRIAPTWMYETFNPQERTRRFIYMNPGDHGMTLPVTNHLTKELMKLMNIEFNEHVADCRPHKIVSEYALPGGISDPVLIYNDSVDSGEFRLGKGHFDKLLGMAEIKCREGYTLIRVGTNEEKILNPKRLPFAHIDLRGKTSVLDLFRLLNSPAVMGSISFDTAIAHVALLYEKPVWICMRRFSRSHREHVMKCVFPSYISKNPISICYL
jgi:hypothetical protein